MRRHPTDQPPRKPVCVIVGATSKWQGDGSNTRLAVGRALDDSGLPPTIRWGIGGALALRFAHAGFSVAVTTRRTGNAGPLRETMCEAGFDCTIVELDLGSESSITAAFARIRDELGDPRVVIYNAGYLEGRALPPQMELLERFPTELFDRAMHVAARGPFLVAKEVLPAMRRGGEGTFLFTNNASALRGRKRRTGESLYYPRTMMRALSQALTEEYSDLGVHVATVVVDGVIDSPGTRAVYREGLMDPAQIADAFFYLHSQDRSVWTHELHLTPSGRTPSV
jgi:NAD(P)-dependent dehydrogenase (short-subunit alcohol dehydrogenase family)